ncbi:MAG: S1 family peptidase [Peptococcaceae bacterium]|nr:S1 family peptidase [Peptococcaceae bacterium]
MDRYFRALKKNRAKLLGLQNVVGVGVGYKQVGEEGSGEPAFIVYVEKKLPAADLARSHLVPKKIDGLNTDVVEIGVVRMLGVRTSRERPCQPGMSIGHYQSTAGTFGAVVKDRATGEWMILSNNHVLANGTSLQEVKARPGDPILQPGPYDGGTLKDRIGVLHRYVPLTKNISVSDCPVASAVARGGTKLLNLVRQNYEIRFYKRYKGENTVDCALAKLDSPDMVRATILEVGDITGVAEARPGTAVMKSGRTTGLTSGMVKSISTTLQVEMKEDEKIWFADQIVTDMPSQPGDSGSVVLDQERKAVGLLFAGSEKLTVFNRITNVMDRLGIEF